MSANAIQKIVGARYLHIFCLINLLFLPITESQSASLVKNMRVDDILMEPYPQSPAPDGYYPNKAMASAANFNQTATGDADDALSIEAVQLTYFSSTGCLTANVLGSGRQTITMGSKSAGVGSTVSLNAQSAYMVGDNDNITMSGVGSIAVVFMSVDGSSVPQSNFTSANYACIPVSCTGSSCTGGGSHSYTLRAAVANISAGDFADGGGVCRCGWLCYQFTNI